MAETYLENPIPGEEKFEFPKEFVGYIEKFELNKAMDFIWRKIAEMDSYIQKKQPFKTIKEDKGEGERMIIHLVQELGDVADLLQIFMPSTSENIKKAIRENKMPEKALFPRKD